MSTFLQDLSNQPSDLVSKLNTSIRVLVAESDTVSRRLICAMLETEPDLAFQCIDNPDVVAAIQDSAPDLVIVDSQTAAIRRAANWEALGVKSPPATIVTSYDTTSRMPFASAEADLLIKPFNVEQFENAMDIAHSKIAASRAQFSVANEYRRSNDHLPGTAQILTAICCRVRGKNCFDQSTRCFVVTVIRQLRSSAFRQRYASGPEHNEKRSTPSRSSYISSLLSGESWAR